MKPVVTTNRTSIPDSEGVLVEENKDGSFKVTIYRVQSPVDLSFNFVTSKEGMQAEKVWTSQGQLYINSALTTQATIYNAAGVLIQTLPYQLANNSNGSFERALYGKIWS